MEIRKYIPSALAGFAAGLVLATCSPMAQPTIVRFGEDTAHLEMARVRVALAEQRANRAEMRAKEADNCRMLAQARLGELYYRELMDVGVFDDSRCADAVAEAMRKADRRLQGRIQ